MKGENTLDEILSFSDFDLIERIGEGGFGEVYKAKHKKTNKIYALKKIKIDQNDENAIKNYKREVQNLKKSDTLFTLTIIGYTIEPPFAIIMPYFKNGNLSDHLYKIKDLDTTQKTIISMGISYGMMKLHSQHIIHRDLKSMNILLDSSFLPVINDFGLAKTMMNTNTTNTFCGTLNWMAPEQYDEEQMINEKVDVYSYGMILYEMLYERIPYEGKAPPQVMRCVTNGVLPQFPYDDQNKSVYDLMKKCISNDPNDRPTFEEIFQEFENFEVMWDDTDINSIKRIFRSFNDDDKESIDKEYPISIKERKELENKEGVLFIPYGKTEIINSEYQNRNDIRIVIFPNSINKIYNGDWNNGAFYECKNLERVILSNSLEIIGNCAFQCCSNLTNINIPSSVTQIGVYAFSYCKSLTNINIPSSVTQIGYDAFSGCSKLTTINIPSSVTQISNSAFYNCSSLTNIYIPSSVTYIGHGAFDCCSRLTNITIPSKCKYDGLCSDPFFRDRCSIQIY